MTSHLRRALSCALAAAGALGLYAAAPARAADPEPIKIGVISEQSAIVGQAILQGAQTGGGRHQRQGRRQRPQDRDHLLR